MKIKSYKVFIENNNQYEEYSLYLQLPFNINEKSDERYDTASILLRKLNRREPFPIETKVKIQILQDSAILNEYDMQIEEDNVTTLYIGIRKYYNHSINLIEYTKKLDNLYLPDFTITNPSTKTIVSPVETVVSNWNINTNSSSTTVVKEYTMTTKYAPNGVTSKNILNIKESKQLKTTPSFNNGYPVNQSKIVPNKTEIELPIPYSGSNLLVNKISEASGGHKEKYQDDSPEYTINETSEINANQLVYLTYYYKSNSIPVYSLMLNLRIDTVTGAVLSSTIYSKSRVILKNNKYYFKIGENGQETIDIKIEISALIKPTLFTSNNTVLKLFKKYHTDSSWTHLPSFNSGMVKSAYFAFDYYYNKSGLVTPDNFTKNDIGNLLLRGEDLSSFPSPEEHLDYITEASRLIADLFNQLQHDISNAYADKDTDPDGWGGDHVGKGDYTKRVPGSVLLAEVTSQFQSLDSFETANKITYGTSGYKTIRDVLEKINILLEPSDRFIIDENDSDLLNINVPERIYTKRNVSEILFEICTLISAYPYLSVDNILSLKRLSPVDNPLYDDYNSDESIVFNSDNGINSYISNITNMITVPDTLKTSYSYWPAKNKFAYPNGNWKNKAITPDTNQIEISNSSGIYYLKYILVKNCLNAVYDTDGNLICDENTVIDITDFCPEESYYNTLYTQNQPKTSNTNKSNCIYWTKGSNVINLDALEAAEKSAIWGTDAPENYKLTRAILYAAKLKYPTLIEANVKTETTKYQFQICYIDYMNGLIKTKKFNQDNLNEIISNYNQTDNNISSQDWLNASQINILRRGNTELDKTIYINDFYNLPKLGELKYGENNERYMADSINYTFDNNICGVNLNYTKYYNKIDPSVTISKDYRQFEIYGKEAVSRDINIDRYLYLDFSEGSDAYEYHKYNLTGAFQSTSRNELPAWMLVFFKDKNKNPIKYHTMTASGDIVEETSKGILLPINYTASGNSVIFQTSLLDNYSAGYYQNLNENLKYIDVFGNDKQSGARTLKEVRYVDDLGDAEYMSIYLIKGDHPAFNQETYPLSSFDTETADIKNHSSVLDYESDILIKKDNREKINIVYQIHFLTHEKNLKWNPAICKYFFYDQENKDSVFSETYDKVLAYQVKYNISNDIMIPLTTDETGILSPDTSSVTNIGTITPSSISILIPSFTTTSKINGITFVYPKTYEILFHIDDTKEASQTVESQYLYFNFYKNRV